MREKGVSRKILGCVCTAVMVLALAGCTAESQNASGEDAADEESTDAETRTARIAVQSIVGNKLSYIELEIETADEEVSTESSTENAGEGIPDEGSTENAGEEASFEGDMDTGQNMTGPAPQNTGSENSVSTEEENVEAGTESSDGTQSGPMPSDGSNQAGPMSADTGSMPQGQMPSSDSSQSGTMPAGGPGTGSSSGDTQFSEGGGNQNSSGNAVTVYLPVRVKVYTESGEETSYSILQEGDILEAVFETDEDGNEVITQLTLTGTSE